MMMEQMNFGGAGTTHVQGDLVSSTWMDGLMNALENDLAQDSSPHSSYVDVNVGRHSPTDSSYNGGGSLSSLESSSSMGGNHSITTPVVSDGSFDFAGPLQSSVGFARSPGAGFGRNVGIDQGYSSLQEFPDPQQRKSGKSGFRHEFDHNTVNGCVSQSIEEGMIANYSRDGSVSSITSCATMSGAGISSYGGPSMVSDSYAKPVGDYQFRQTSAQQPQPQVKQRQQIQTRAWSGQPEQQRQCQPHQQQHEQQQLQQEEEGRRQSSEPEAEDSGLRLVHLLLICAQSIQRGELLFAESTLMKINQALAIAPQQAGRMGRVAAHFAEALTKRLYGVSPNSQEALLTSAGIKQEALSEILHFQFYETCPYLKFSHFTANQAILEAFKGAKHVHVIDLNLNHGLQWPALIQALALRPGGPPILRLTGIGQPEVGQGEDSLKEIGMSLARLAESVKVIFEFRGVVASNLDDIKPRMLHVRPGEVVAVNSMMQFHKLLYSDISKPAGIDDVLCAVRSLNPKVVAMSEQEANHNCPNFLDRFLEALHYYSSMFDSLEASNFASGSAEQMLAEMYLGREICNIVACEGARRLERHETLDQWRIRLHNAGFLQIHMGPDAFKQASMLLTLFSGQGYRVEDNQGCLTLCWHGRPLIAASAWHCA